MTVVTRFPPSPTGNLHIGGARTALFNYLFAKHHGGKIYLRLENTDEERSKLEYEQNILESLRWLGLSFDSINGQSFLRQSERKDIYKSYLKKIIEDGSAYISREKEGERAEVIRFKNPNKKLAFTDLLRGSIEFDTTELGDMIIAKSPEEPLYHLAVVIDDHEMGVTHVIRGEDHISNTPRQILLQEALGFRRPAYAHIPLILAPDRSKLSKRHGAVSVVEYRERGFVPEALLNYLALLGWNPGTEQELFTMEELMHAFDLDKVQKGGAIFNEEKLRWMNREYLKKMEWKSLVPHLSARLLDGRDAGQLAAIAETLLSRFDTFGDMEQGFSSGEFDYLFSEPDYSKELLAWEKATENPKSHLAEVLAILGRIPETSFTKDAVREALLPYATANGKGNVLWPVRVALSGKRQSPDPFTLAAMVGKRATEMRLGKALRLLS